MKTMTAEVKQLQEIARLRQWVADLQSGMYVNCVYCGHRYGPADEVPVSMADTLKQHVAQCPDHPMSKLVQAMEWFCQRVERGEVLSKLTYAKFKEILDEARGKA